MIYGCDGVIIKRMYFKICYKYVLNVLRINSDKSTNSNYADRCL